MRAYEILNESKTVHMTHFEDLLLSSGYAGAIKAIKYSAGVRKMLASGNSKSTKVTVKWDGSPAIFAGTDPEDGKFFVGTKAVLSKSPKYIKRPEDVSKYYSEQPELGLKLTAAFNHLRKLGIVGILQGDLMFTENDVEIDTISGEQYYTFTPNTITYAVPVASELGKKINRAKLGIVFHTAHDWPLQKSESSFHIDISKLKKTPDVWFDDATYKDYTGIVSLTPQESEHVRQEIIAAKARIAEIGKKNIDDIVNYPEFKRTIQVYINSKIRQGVHNKNPEIFIDDFLNFYKERTLKDVDLLKSDKAKASRHQKVNDKMQWLKINQKIIYKLIDLYNHLVELKGIIIDKLNTIDGLKTFVKSGDAYEVTNPEGFVAVGNDGGAVKLVNRLEFSRQNFNRRQQ